MAKDRKAFDTSDMARREGISLALCPTISATSSGGIRDPIINEHYTICTIQKMNEPGDRDCRRISEVVVIKPRFAGVTVSRPVDVTERVATINNPLPYQMRPFRACFVDQRGWANELSRISFYVPGQKAPAHLPLFAHL